VDEAVCNQQHVYVSMYAGTIQVCCCLPHLQDPEWCGAADDYTAAAAAAAGGVSWLSGSLCLISQTCFSMGHMHAGHAPAGLHPRTERSLLACLASAHLTSGFLAGLYVHTYVYVTRLDQHVLNGTHSWPCRAPGTCSMSSSNKQQAAVAAGSAHCQQLLTWNDRPTVTDADMPICCALRAFCKCRGTVAGLSITSVLRFSEVLSDANRQTARPLTSWLLLLACVSVQ
jgi:hypothetical protein